MKLENSKDHKFCSEFQHNELIECLAQEAIAKKIELRNMLNSLTEDEKRRLITELEKLDTKLFYTKEYTPEHYTNEAKTFI